MMISSYTHTSFSLKIHECRFFFRSGAEKWGKTATNLNPPPFFNMFVMFAEYRSEEIMNF